MKNAFFNIKVPHCDKSFPEIGGFILWELIYTYKLLPVLPSGGRFRCCLTSFFLTHRKLYKIIHTRAFFTTSDNVHSVNFCKLFFPIITASWLYRHNYQFITLDQDQYLVVFHRFLTSKHPFIHRPRPYLVVSQPPGAA